MSSSVNKRGLVPKLRFPEFRDAGGWEVKELGEFISTTTPPAKLLTSDYLAEGQFPVIDQSQSYICGWTNNDDAIIDDHLPLIVFGDHTCILKLINQPFAQGADGIKIFKPNNSVQTEFLYQSLQFKPLVMEQYKRHFSILRERKVAYPDRKTGEQQKIADCLSSIDELVAAETQKLATLKTHKKGLMQQLFPAEGETLPKLRFPEFRDAGEWEERKAGALFANRVEDGEEGLPIYSVTMNDGMVKRSSLERRVDDIAESGGNKKVRKGDIAYNMMRMWQGAFGVSKEDCMVSPAYVVLSPESDACPDFFGYLFKLPKYLQLLTSHSQGLTLDRLRLYYKDFARITVLIPSPPEQQKIARCLSSIDELVAAHTQNLATLKTHKKGLMQQLFPNTETCHDHQ